MPRVDEIANLIFQEALARERSLGIPEKVCEVEVEVMLLVMETLAEVRAAERRENKLDK